MRVAFAIQHYPPYLGGAERQAALLAPAIAAESIELTVVTTRFRPDLASHETDARVRIVRLPTPAFRPAKLALNLLSSFVYFFFALRQLDVVHAHCLSPFTLGAILAARLRRRPILVKACSIGAMGEAVKIKRGRLTGRILWWLFSTSDLVIAPTEAVASELAREGMPTHKVRVIPNLLKRPPPAPVGFDRRASRAALGLPERITLLYVGRLSPEKGLDRLMAVWPGLSRSRAAGLVIVGDGPDRLKIAQWRDRHGLGDSVQLVGYQANPEPYFRAADIFVYPSRSETFGNAIVEAMSYGLAVATPEVGVVKEWDGFRGICRLDPDHPDRVRESLSKLIADETLRRRMGREAQAFVAERYLVEAGVQNYQALYRELIAAAHRR
ncbi:MAG: glycosyltransferase family 4 protein [Chromatiaceae bacterium]|nr:glycosyltransferase family 4 protein [Chromatiaceae bacterium]